MGVQTNSLNRTSARAPRIADRRPPGYHRTSVIHADIVNLDQGVVDVVPLTPGDTFNALLFLSDMAISIESEQRYAPVTDPVLHPTVITYRQPLRVNGELTVGSSNNVFTPTTTPTVFEEHATGLSVTNSVPVSGYHVFMVTELLGIVTPASPECRLLVTAKCPLLAGPPWDDSERQILLLETGYTQAMADAGNYFTIGLVTYRIVGLWNEVPVA